MKKYRNEKEHISNISEEDFKRKKEVVTSFFLDQAYVKMTAKQIAAILEIPKEEKELLNQILHTLEQEGLVFADDSKRYVLLAAQKEMVKCKYQAKTAKFGFGIVEDGEDVYIASSMAADAMDGDDVLVRILQPEESGRKKEGRVEKVLSRNTKTIIGRFLKSENFGFVEPIDVKLRDIYIPKKQIQNYENGQIVEVEITKYATKTSKAEGKIKKVIAEKDADNIEVKAMYQSYGLDTLESFGDLVDKEVKMIPDHVLPEEKIGREDRTDRTVYTIDGDDAKDLDDGVFVEKTVNGTYILSVYIADVSHYVKDGTFLDQEAQSRGTSIYIPGTVLPMLPRPLSNGICSLNQGVERLSLAIDITFDDQGNVLDSYIFQTIIKVTKRMTYDKVFQVIENSNPEVLQEYAPYREDIMRMKELAEILFQKRKEKGSINFDIPDTKVVLDEDGNLKDIAPYDKTIANDIIEEFMLAANSEIAKTFFFLEYPFIYRIHEKPDEEKLRDLNLVLSNYKKRIKGIKNVQPKTLSHILDEIVDPEEKQIVSTYMLRTLKLAKYSEECSGHFGLAAKYYCHFTSPIRRYPDLFIHRVIATYLENGYTLPEDKETQYRMQAPGYAMHSSDMEKQATTIERDFDDLYKVMYMVPFVHDEFEATVSSITSFGMFVRLENTVEGLVPFDYMPGDDYYEYDESRKILVGKRKGRVFKIGDKITVELIRCDVKSKQVDFMVK